MEDFFAGPVSRTGNMEETENFVFEMVERRTRRAYYPFLVMDTITGDFVSFFDLKNLDWNIPKNEIGFFTDVTYAGKG